MPDVPERPEGANTCTPSDPTRGAHLNLADTDPARWTDGREKMLLEPPESAEVPGARARSRAPQRRLSRTDAILVTLHAGLEIVERDARFIQKAKTKKQSSS